MRVDFPHFETLTAPPERTAMTYEDILKNPELLHEIEQRARRERGIAIRELIARLFNASRTTGHAPRPHLAH
jgi:hypothetical protein